MGVSKIHHGSLLYLGVLIAAVLIMNIVLDIKLNRRILYSITRMSIQLLLVSVFLHFLLDIDNPFITVLYVIFMISVAVLSTVRSAKLKIRKFYVPIFVAFVVPNMFMLWFLHVAIIDVPTLFAAKYTIPIVGMILGNSLSGIIVGINELYNTIKEHHREYCYYLALSGDKHNVLRPYFRKAMYSAMKPTLAIVGTTGIVFLPGMMTGQILGGVSPLIAIQYQIVITVAILVTKYFALLLSAYLLILSGFDDYDMPCYYS